MPTSIGRGDDLSAKWTAGRLRRVHVGRISDSTHNRRQAPGLRQALGERYATRPAELLDQLVAGRSITRSGPLLI